MKQVVGFFDGRKEVLDMLGSFRGERGIDLRVRCVECMEDKEMYWVWEEGQICRECYGRLYDEYVKRIRSEAVNWFWVGDRYLVLELSRGYLLDSRFMCLVGAAMHLNKEEVLRVRFGGSYIEEELRIYDLMVWWVLDGVEMEVMVDGRDVFIDVRPGLYIWLVVGGKK